MENVELTTKEAAIDGNNMLCVSRKTSDYDIWYMPCERCGYDTAKSTKPTAKEDNKRCWKCGHSIYRDYSDRALKKA